MNPPEEKKLSDMVEMKSELGLFDTPEKRSAFLAKHGLKHHMIVSGPELTAIQIGTDHLHAQIRNWRVLSQALFGVSSPEEALEFAKAQKKHREGIMNDRMRYRNALLEVMKRIKADNPEAWQIAFNAINP